MNERTILAASILSADLASLGDQIAQAESAGADWIHIDVMDGQFVPNLAFGPVVVAACRRVTKLPLDVHLMIDRPRRYLEMFRDAGADALSVHVEAQIHLHRTLQEIRSLGMRTGVALNPATSVAVLHDVLDLTDLVLVMTVNPGFYGQPFLKTMMPKVRAARELLDASGSPARLQVDGGLTAQTAPLALQAGADTFVAASAIFNYPDGIEAGVASLRASITP